MTPRLVISSYALVLLHLLRWLQICLGHCLAHPSHRYFSFAPKFLLCPIPQPQNLSRAHSFDTKRLLHPKQSTHQGCTHKRPPHHRLHFVSFPFCYLWSFWDSLSLTLRFCPWHGHLFLDLSHVLSHDGLAEQVGHPHPFLFSWHVWVSAGPSSWSLLLVDSPAAALKQKHMERETAKQATVSVEALLVGNDRKCDWQGSKPTRTQKHCMTWRQTYTCYIDGMVSLASESLAVKSSSSLRLALHAFFSSWVPGSGVLSQHFVSGWLANAYPLVWNTSRLCCVEWFGETKGSLCSGVFAVITSTGWVSTWSIWPFA